MRLPPVIPSHEYPLSETLRWLIACKTAFVNGFGGTATESLPKYQRKAVELSRGLEFIFSFDDVQKMLLTRRHWLLMEMVVAGNGPTVNDLISAETTERQRYFETLVQTYTQVQAQRQKARGFSSPTQTYMSTTRTTGMRSTGRSSRTPPTFDCLCRTL